MVGINPDIFSQTGGLMGVSFTIPLKAAIDVADQTQNRGLRLTRLARRLPPEGPARELAESFQLYIPIGALIAQVLPQSSAQSAGIRAGHVILSYDGRPVPYSAAMPRMVGGARAGKEVRARILRGDKKITQRLVIEELPGNERAQQARTAPRTEVVLGLKIQAISEAQRRALGLESGGLQVIEVGQRPAQIAGLPQGEILQRLNHQKPTSIERFRALVQDLPNDKSASLLVQHKQGPEFLASKAR